MKATHAILVAVVAQQATATWNMFAKPFTSPNYNDNECSDKQKGGFDWSDLKDGDSNFQYGDFDFSAGWKCSSAFGKRDALTKRTFGNKAIINSCGKQKPASFGCNKRKSGFSITTIDVSVEFDVMVDLHYTMNDGSICKQKSVPCKKEGSTIQNTQCGGAKSVDVYLGSSYKGSKSSCQIGFHHIGFDCNPGKPYTPPSPPAIPSSAPVVPPPVSSKPPTLSSAPPASSKATQSTQEVASSPVSPPASCNGGYGEGCPPVKSSPVATPPAATPPVATSPVSSSPVATPPAVSPPVATPPVATPPSQTPSSEAPPYAVSSPAPFGNSSAVLPPTYKTTQVPPPPPPSQESSSAIPSLCNGGYGGSCGASSGVSPSQPPSTPLPSSAGPTVPSPPASSPVYPPLQGGEVPPQLPQCMNTWLEISTEDCKDNTATDCYCKNSKFTKNVIDCVQAWCETDEQTKKALQYLVGICAQHVPENPGLVSDCPGDTFSPPSTPSGGVGSSAGPVPTPGPSGTPPPSQPVTTIVYGSTSITVPAVHFSTETPVAGATPTAPVGLVPGNAPPSAPAATTPVAPYPVPSTLRPTTVPTGTGAVRPSSPAQFTGAASPFKVDAKHAMLGAALAFLAL